MGRDQPQHLEWGQSGEKRKVREKPVENLHLKGFYEADEQREEH